MSSSPFRLLLCLIGGFALHSFDTAVAKGADQSTFIRDVQPVFVKYCVGCHSGTDAESNVRLDTHANILAGSDDRNLVVAGKPGESLILGLILGEKEPKMPPEDSPQMSEQEIATIRSWIETGCLGNDNPIPLKNRLRVNPIPSRFEGNLLTTALGFVPETDTYVIGGYNRIERMRDNDRTQLAYEIVGKVNQIRLTSDHRFAAISSGLPGVGGQATVLSLENGEFRFVRSIEAHADALYTAVLSPDGQTLATGSYDRVVQLWNVSDGTLIRKLTGHNGAIYDLDFDATGTVLASASGDETIKIWNVATGDRLDTLGQGEAEQYAVRFDSRRNRIVAVGADRRIRVWELQSMVSATVSPMLYSVFAHEGSITQLALSEDGKFIATTGEDKSIKLWNSQDISLIGVVGKLENDVPSGLQFDRGSIGLIVSSLTGRLQRLPLPQQVNPAPSTAASALALVRPAQTIASDNVSSVDELPQHRDHTTPQVLGVPTVVSGVLTPQDMSGNQAGDWYAFDARANESVVVTVDAARSGSPLDSFLDILDEAGKPVLRTRLQAVRESYFTFRGKDSMNSDDFRLHRWEDMELNEFLYAGGEVVKLWLYPRGPDSGFKVYPGFGNRFTYFDTTATTHALNEPAWVVRELRDDSTPLPNGLPVFPVFYANDDESSRKLGKDSQLTFTPKTNGRYLIRVRDARGQSGEDYKYKLSVQRPFPQFIFRLEQNEITLRPGVGTEFSVIVERFAGCEGDIMITIDNPPPGIQITSPLIVESGQLRAYGSIYLPENQLPSIPKEFTLSATARTSFEGAEIVGDGEKKLTVKVNEQPTLKLRIVGPSQSPDASQVAELVVRPGQTISANLVIERNGQNGDIAFGGDDSGRNLPHGCYIDNIGLNGLLIPADQTIREFFITAAPWVESQSRPFHLRAIVDGNPTTLPVLIRVSKD